MHPVPLVTQIGLKVSQSESVVAVVLSVQFTSEQVAVSVAPAEFVHFLEKVSHVALVPLYSLQTAVRGKHPVPFVQQSLSQASHKSLVL